MKVNIEALVTKMLAGARWIEDCGDKQDFDFPVLSVSTRVYGRDNTAYPSILLFTDGNVHDDYITLARADIEGDTLSQTKAEAEKWIRDRLFEIVPLILDNIDLTEDEQKKLVKRGLALEENPTHKNKHEFFFMFSDYKQLDQFASLLDDPYSIRSFVRSSQFSLGPLGFREFPSFVAEVEVDNDGEPTFPKSIMYRIPLLVNFTAGTVIKSGPGFKKTHPASIDVFKNAWANAHFAYEEKPPVFKEDLIKRISRSTSSVTNKANLAACEIANSFAPGFINQDMVVSFAEIIRKHCSELL